MAKFLCHCCGAVFKSEKPQDHNRDKGYGTCEECRRFFDWEREKARGCWAPSEETA